MLKHVTAKFGDLEVVARGSDRLTYNQLDQRSAQLAKGMLAQGIGKGSRIALLMKNGPDFAVTFMAAARIGALVNPLSTLFQPPELAWVLRHADIDTLFMDTNYLHHDYLDRMEEAFPELKRTQNPILYLPDAPYLRHVHIFGEGNRPWAQKLPQSLVEHPNIKAIDEAGLLEQAEEEVYPSDLSFVIYTSGSTGNPKGVVHYHGNAVRHSYRMGHEYMLIDKGDRIASARPWFWIAGLSANLLYTMQKGGCVVVQEKDDPHCVIDLIEKEKLTFISGLSPQFSSLSATLDAENSPYTFRLVGNNTGGIALRPTKPGEDVKFVNERLENRIPAAKMNKTIDHFASFYGMSETLAAHTGLPHPNYLPEDKVPSCGRAFSGMEHKIVDQETGKILGPNEPGELYVRGYSIMDGLYKQERRDTFEPDGFYRTGDICAIDEDGYLTISGRVDDMVKVSGANVSPIEVERALNLMTGVRDCAVFAFPNSDGKMILVAGVLSIPAAPITEQEAIDYLKSQISSFKVPKRIFMFDREEVPHTGSGKIVKRQFKPMVQKALEQSTRNSV